MFDLRPLLLSNAINTAAMMAFVVIIGPLVRLLNLQEWHGGLLLSMAGVMLMLTSRSWGHCSELRGRKPILLIGVLGFAISYFALALFVNYALNTTSLSVLFIVVVLGLIRGVIGGFYAAIPTASGALIADHFPAEIRASKMAMLGAGSAIGMIFGPLIASFFVSISLAAPMYFAAVLPVISLLLLWRGLPVEEVKEVIAPPPVKLTDKRLRLALLGGITAMSCVVTAQITVGFFTLDVLKQTTQGAATLSAYAMTAVGITLVLIQTVMVKLPKVTAQTWLALGSFIAACSFLSAGFISEPIHLIMMYSVAALGLGLVFPAVQAIAANSVTEGEQGVAAGTLSACQGLGMIIAPLVATTIYTLSPSAPYLFCGVILLLLSVITISHKIKLRSEQIS